MVIIYFFFFTLAKPRYLFAADIKSVWLIAARTSVFFLLYFMSFKCVNKSFGANIYPFGSNVYDIFHDENRHFAYMVSI